MVVYLDEHSIIPRVFLSETGETGDVVAEAEVEGTQHEEDSTNCYKL